MKLIKDKNFYRMLILITIPIALQNLITFMTNMMDTVMLGRADPTGTLLSASSLANQPFFILQMFIFGVAGGGSVLASQYWGKSDLKSVKIVISMVLKIGIIVSAAASALILLFPEQVMRLYSSQEDIIGKGVEYLQILGYAYLLFGVTFTFMCSLRSIEIVRISVFVSLVSLVTNIGLNYILIFGHLGFEPMGIKGAAIATLIARAVEFLIITAYVFIFEKRLKFTLRDVFLFNGTLFKDLIKHGSPVLANELLWGLGISVQAAILGHITYSSGNPVAANSIAGTVQQLCNIVGFGIANAASVIVGKSIGAGDTELAKKQASTIKKLAVFVGLAAFILVFVLRRPIVSFYNITAETAALAVDMMVVVAFVAFFATLSGIYIVGILRGAGDTKFCLVLEIVCLWFVATPLAALLAFGFALPVPLVLVGMKSDEMIKSVVCLFRMNGSRWVKSVTRTFPEEKQIEP